MSEQPAESSGGKPEEPLPSLLSVLAMPVSLVLTVGALGLGLLVGIDTGGETSAATPTATETSTEPPAAAAEGEQVFASQGCGGCHTLAAAGAGGTVGPSLDQTQLSTEQIADVVTNGRAGTAMTSFKDRLTPEQIQAVAAYVSAAKAP